ncbi:DNA (cytosine-5-)-methyltransferase [Treponema putidum]|uniref:DNA (cytosine-5-)-methyltransferase n=1 Tax=Treponema putidum TaxID=221027 RepID=UPI003D8EDEE9
MTYLSVCSGIEAATVAWDPLGFTPVGFAEIEPFPCELLRQKYPNVKNYGDITNYEKWNIEQFDILVGGTPCQSFSIAGKRGGTDDIRGQLMYSYLDIVGKYKPQWVIWENVPGVLSSNKGYDFASFLAGLEEYGYGWAYRVLDAQYFGVPQRRRRVFVIGHFHNRTDFAAKVLFEQESLCGDIATSSKMQQNTSAEAGSGIKSMLYLTHPQKGDYTESNGIAGTVTAAYGEGGGHVPFLLEHKSSVEKNIDYFRRGGNHKYHRDEKSSTLRNTASPDCFDLVLAGEKKYIRRLTPLECERLQGFPDNYTQIEWNGKPKDQCPDSHRYKAIGNSMAVPVMRWIGERIKRNKV